LPTEKIISPSAVCIGKPTAIPCCRNRWTALTISSALSAKLPTTSSLNRHDCGNGRASLGGQDGLPTGFPQRLHAGRWACRINREELVMPPQYAPPAFSCQSPRLL
jgi:hypothetical protein